MNLYSGHVQGVGFRPFVHNLAARWQLAGYELTAEGVKEELTAFLQAIRESDVGGFIRQEQTIWSEANNEFRGFEITH